MEQFHYLSDQHSSACYDHQQGVQNSARLTDCLYTSSHHQTYFFERVAVINTLPIPELVPPRPKQQAQRLPAETGIKPIRFLPLPLMPHEQMVLVNEIREGRTCSSSILDEEFTSRGLQQPLSSSNEVMAHRNHGQPPQHVTNSSVMQLHRMVFPVHSLPFGAPVYHISHNSGHVDSRLAGLPCVTEIRREKSRDAARSRRGKENYEFLSLSRLLPLPSAITGQLDKASIIRLCISTLKLRKFARQGEPPWPMAPPKLSNHEKRLPVPVSSRESVEINFGSHVLQAHDGFVVALSAEGHILYISETVSVYLGLSQVELTGSSLFEYVHEEDRMELAEALNIPWDPAVIFQDVDPPTRLPSQEPSSDSEDGMFIGPLSMRADRPFGNTSIVSKLPFTSAGWKLCLHKVKTNYCVRFRSTLTKRGVQMKYSGYRVLSLQWNARVGNPSSSEHSTSDRSTLTNYGFTMCATALPSLNMNELRVDKSSFTMKLALDFKVLSCDPKIEELLEYSPERVVDASYYNLTYGADHDLVCELHRDVLRKGQTMSSYYRIMGSKGGYHWVQTCAHLMAASKTPHYQCIVTVHTLISNVQHESDLCGILSSKPPVGPASDANARAAIISGKVEKRRLPNKDLFPPQLQPPITDKRIRSNFIATNVPSDGSLDMNPSLMKEPKSPLPSGKSDGKKSRHSSPQSKRHHADRSNKLKR
ncbi:Neuronal PAS domain-containing protein 3 [Hypsibius exemplaris]|uniref:Neuronal PAS domain-containing protein 3 n=1 Tax=Hypsibius exemplaris TaxID=2072580 RepID=A0A1W0WJV0_HYPEX|nr:Neuronal PAS domain-containing protein 3 [Hypsibius exemplaris]